MAAIMANANMTNVTMPAMPRSGFVVVEPELVLGSLKAVLDRPAVAFDVAISSAVPATRCGLPHDANQ